MSEAPEPFEQDYDEYMREEVEKCSTCRGRGTVNELTAPKGFLCFGNEECPDCDGTGELQ